MNTTYTIKFDTGCILSNPEDALRDFIADGMSEREALRGLISDGIFNYIMETQYPGLSDSVEIIEEVGEGEYKIHTTTQL